MVADGHIRRDRHRASDRQGHANAFMKSVRCDIGHHDVIVGLMTRPARVEHTRGWTGKARTQTDQGAASRLRGKICALSTLTGHVMMYPAS